jgi:hypothetical protein
MFLDRKANAGDTGLKHLSEYDVIDVAYSLSI